jgi:hypothetical protein
MVAALTVAFICWKAYWRAMEGERVRLLPVPVATPSERTFAAAAAASFQSPARLAAPVPVGPRIASYGEQKDMWAFAKQAEASPDADLKFEGYMAAAECIGFATQYDHFTEIANTALRSGEQGRYLALEALRRRCQGFFSAGAEYGHELRRSLKAQIASSGSGMAPLVAGRELTLEEKIAVLQSGSPAAIELVLPSIDSQSVGVLLAMCDLGKACGKESYSAELYCLFTGACGMPLWGDAAKDFESAEWESIQLEKSRIVRSVKEHDARALFSRTNAGDRRKR